MRDEQFRGDAGRSCRAIGLAAALVLAGPVATALAQSGETGGTAGVTVVPAATCNSIRTQFTPTFPGDVFFACYGDETANPACGFFSTEDVPGQTNVLAFCQDSFPNGVSVRREPPLKSNVVINATAFGHTTGLNGTLPSNATLPSNVVCLDFDDGGGPPDKEVCVKVDRTTTGSSPASCTGATAYFRIIDGDCTAVQNVVNAVAGATAGAVSFALFTDINTLGQAGSQGLLVCSSHRASCVDPPVDNAALDFPGGVRVRYQIPLAIIDENPTATCSGAAGYADGQRDR